MLKFIKPPSTLVRRIYHGDLFELLPELDANSMDACVTDPPYGFEFMGKTWDTHRDQAFHRRWAKFVFRVMKPGAYLVVFGGTRTFHRLTCGVEDAGFEIRDCLTWLYGTGFPKSLNVSKAIDEAAGAERQVIGRYELPDVADGRRAKGWECDATAPSVFGASGQSVITAPSTEAAKQWEGWGTALKPAWEPIILARKPLNGTVAQNVLRHGTGALNIDATRIEADGRPARVSERRDDLGTAYVSNAYAGRMNESLQPGSRAVGQTDLGRWPANVLLDEHAAAMLDEQSGELTSGDGCHRQLAHRTTSMAGTLGMLDRDEISYGDAGGASRFFYCTKPSRSERDYGCESLPATTAGEATDRVDGTDGLNSPRAGSGRTGGSRNHHPTVKPVKLMRYLVKLVTPPGGTVLDPFLGSGTTAMACVREGVGYVGIEREEAYVKIAECRVAAVGE